MGRDGGRTVADGWMTGRLTGGRSGPPETRTPDPLIKSQLLYQLS